MLTIHDNQSSRYCDGRSRRNFFRIGGLGAGSLLFPEWLRKRAAAGQPPGRSNKSVIMICLGGGPSHIDTYDMRPDSPAEYRGEFRPVASKVPGMPMCELMPRQSAIADRFSVVRSMAWKEPCHQYSEICSGYPVKEARPGFGAIVNRLYPGGTRLLPRFVGLGGDGTSDRQVAEQPRYAGAAYRSFSPSGPAMENFSLPKGMTLDRLDDRAQLRTAFDTVRRDLDHSGEFAARDAFTRQAMEVVTGDSVREAFDLSKEPPRLRDRYGNKASSFQYLGVKYGFEFANRSSVPGGWWKPACRSCRSAWPAGIITAWCGPRAASSTATARCFLCTTWRWRR